MDSDIYFGTLQSLRTHATKLRKKDEAEEKRLMEYLPVNERMGLDRENKVLTKWQERQRDWERIEQRISKKLSSKVARPLMMTVTDEYRSKIEEYDLIQAAIPLKDRYAESSWQMTLRGGGPITVAIGHIFSGLECEIDPHFPKPKMVRKPKPTSAVFKNDTFLEESENLTMKRKQYEKSIKEIRPHTLTYRDAGQLVIRSTDLFQWAEESSLEYVKRQREEELARIEEEMQSLRSLESSQEQEEDITNPDHPQLTFLSSTEVVLDTYVGKQVHRTVSFKNSGPVVLYYRWKKLQSEGKSQTQESKAKSLVTIHGEKGDDDAPLRAHVMDKHREKFFCLNDCGEILPDEVVTTDFIFDSDVGGVYRSHWILQFIPEETRINIDENNGSENHGVHFEDEKLEREGSQVSQHKPKTGSIGIALRGHCIVPDESMTNRSLLSAHISYQTEVTEIQDIIYACVRRVRSPVRIPDLQARQRDLFAQRNTATYEAYFPQVSKRTLAPWKLTNDRIERIEQVHHAVGRLYDKLHDRFVNTWNEVNEPTNNIVAAAVPAPSLPSSLQWQNLTQLTSEDRLKMMQLLFPESEIDIFDEVTVDDIEPRWNFDVSSSLKTLETLAIAAEFLAALENVLLLRAKKQKKLDEKLARKAAKKAAGDSDDEDEDEEEEEEDDDEAKAKQRKPQHLLAIEVQQLKDAIEGELLSLQTTLTFSTDTVFSLTRDALCRAIDSICDAQQSALEAANLMELVNHTLGSNATNAAEGFTGFVNHAVISPMINPFLTDEGAQAFDSLLALTSPDPQVDTSAPAAKGKGKEAAGKKGKEVAPAPATSLQVDFYHKVFYEKVRGTILDNILRTVDIAPPVLSFSTSTETSSMVEQLTKAAVWRPDDVSNKVVFYTFDFAQRIDTSDPQEASLGIGFDAIARKIKYVANEIASLVLTGEPACLLLLSSACAFPEEVWKNRATEMEHNLQYHWEKQVLQYRKQMKRAKQIIPEDHVSNKSLQIVNHIDSWASLTYDLIPSVLRQRQPDSIPVFIIPDLNLPRLVPAVPPYEWEEDDDEDPAVAIGNADYAALHYQRYLASYPLRIPVQTSSMGAGRLKNRRASFKRQENDGPSCFCDISAAIVDLKHYICDQFYEGNPHAIQWIDSTTQHFFQPQLPLFKIHDASYKKVLPRDAAQLALMKLQRDSVLCGQQVRESLLWNLLPRFLLPAWSYFLESNSSVEQDSLREHVRQLFPAAIAEQRKPRSIFILGGAMRAEKLRLLDELIALFPTIYLVGEVAVRFLGIQSPQSISVNAAVGDRASRFQTVCRKLLAKARVMGCELILPTDFVVGEESQHLSVVHTKLFHHDASFCAPLPAPLLGMQSVFPPPGATAPEVSNSGLSRSDAVDYDGDTKIVSAVDLLALSQPIPLPPYPPTPEELIAQEEEKKKKNKAGNSLLTVTTDAVYDIGPVSQQRLKAAVENSELTYIYGTAGYTELSTFQGGHNSIVQALLAIFTKENAAAEARKAQRKEAAKIAGKGSVAATQLAYASLQPTWLERAQHVVLLGEETVDWFGRSLDPDADFLGDLVASGHVSYSNSNSALFIGSLVVAEEVVTPPQTKGISDAKFSNALLEENLIRRLPLEKEFVFSRAKNLDDDEEDEEDDDDEEEED